MPTCKGRLRHCSTNSSKDYLTPYENAPVFDFAIYEFIKGQTFEKLLVTIR